MDTNKQSLLEMAISHHQHNQLEAAEKCYREVLLIEPHHLDAQLNLSQIFLRTQRPQEALNILLPLSKNQPESVAIWNNLAVAQKFLMDLEGSLYSFERASSLNPESPEIKHDISMVLQLMNRNEEALELLRNLSHTNPSYLAARFFHSQLLNSLFRFEESEQVLTSILADNPHHIEALLALGKLHKKSGSLAKASTYFKMAIDKNPGNPEAHVEFGNLLCHQGDFQAGVQHLNHATQLAPQDWVTHFHLGNAFLQHSRFEEALGPLKKALTLSPGNETVRSALSWIYKRFVPQWHMSMIADRTRNQAYEQAMAKVVEPETIVFDIGAGSGLLSMMAARLGAKHVYTCELSKVMADMAEEIIAKNNLQDQITLYPVKSTSLTPENFEKKPTVLVSEILDAGLIGEHAIPTLRHALQELCDESCTVIPARALLIGKLVSIPDMRAVNPVMEIEGFDFTPFDQFRVPKEYLVEDLTKYPHTTLSNPCELKTYDFYNLGVPVPEHQWHEKSFEIDVTNSGKLDACAFWFKLWLDDEITITTDPDEPIKHHCWNQAIYFFENKVDVQKGQVARIKMTYNDIKIQFEIIEIISKNSR